MWSESVDALVSGASGHGLAQVLRLAAGQQLGAQHRAEGLRGDVGAGPRRDGAGDRVRLLRRDAALLDRERRTVAGGEDVIGADDAAEVVDGQEPVGVGAQAADAGALEPRQRDDALRAHEDVARGGDHLAVARRGGRGCWGPP